MEDTVLQRVRKIIDYFSISDRKFAEYISIPQTTLASLFQRGNEPNVAIIQSILGRFPNISMGWLLFGHGDMFINKRGDKLKNIRESLSLSINEFASKLGIRDEFYMRMESGEIPIDELYKNKLISIFGVNPNDIPYDMYANQLFLEDVLSANEQVRIDTPLVTQEEKNQNSSINNKGNDSMLKSEKPTAQVPTFQEEGTPLLPVEAWGGSLSGSSIAVLAEQCKKYNVPINNIDYLIPIAGDSMMPDYCPGDIVGIKKINERAFIEWGKVYVLDTCNGVVIKEVQPSDNEGSITCISHNMPERYRPFEVSLNPEDFYGMYAVKGTVRIS